MLFTREDALEGLELLKHAICSEISFYLSKVMERFFMTEMNNYHKGNQNSSHGGAATQSGICYQNRVAAWITTLILAETSISLPWELSAGISLSKLYCETEQPIDDLLAVTSNNGYIFFQVKHRLNLESRIGSALSSCIDQFVRQFISWQHNPKNNGKIAERSLDPSKDRFIIVTSPLSSTSITDIIPETLNRLRQNGIFNKQENNVLGILSSYITHYWNDILGTKPTVEEIGQILNLVWVYTLDLDNGGAAELEAKDNLRQVIIREPNQVDIVWSLLIQICETLAVNRGSIDRYALQQKLINTGISLKSTQSFLSDIQNLKEYTRKTTANLSDLSIIRVGEKREVKISRKCIGLLQDAAELNSILIIGDPGAGKSGALHDLVTVLLEEQKDVIFLAIDRLNTESDKLLQIDLGLTHDLYDVLENWLGDKEGFLVIDALDAARTEQSIKIIRDLLTRVVRAKTRWKVIASIRKFDLRYDQVIRSLFVGEPPSKEFQDEEFKKLRHIKIPIFSDEELEQVGVQSSELAILINNAETKFRELISIPFNLRLLGDLLGEGVSELAPISTQIELLDSYWKVRIIGRDGQRDAREFLLRRIIEKMIESRKLRVGRSQVIETPHVSDVLNDLLKSHVIDEWQISPSIAPDGSILTLSHHVLFDYAVARLLLRETSDNIIKLLQEKPDLILVIRPSLVLHFQYEWLKDKTRIIFWELVFSIIQINGIPEVVKLIGPVIAVDTAVQIEDFNYLIQYIKDKESRYATKTIETTFQHLIGAFILKLKTNSIIEPWPDLFEIVSNNLTRQLAFLLRYPLNILCEHPEKLNDEQLNKLGIAARRLLKFAWAEIPPDERLVISALESVCRTFKSNITESEILLRKCIELSHLKEYGYKELPWLAREIERIIPFNSKFVEDVYIAAFSFEDDSKEYTHMGSSRILPLRSNRSQDYNGARYHLSQIFPNFLEQAPLEAAKALIKILESYVVKKHSFSFTDSEEKDFDFNNHKAKIISDYSITWDGSGVYGHDEPIKMLDAFNNYLDNIGNNIEKVDLLKKIISLIVNQNRLAVLWRRLLSCGTEKPMTIGLEIRSLAWSIPILTCQDTIIPLGKFLSKIYTHLSIEERVKVELKILSISETYGGALKEIAQNIIDTLLWHIPLEIIATNEAKQQIQKIKAQKFHPISEPRFDVQTHPYTERDYLVEQGVPIDEEPNKIIHELEEPIKNFSREHLNIKPNLDEIRKVFPALTTLKRALLNWEINGIHPKIHFYAFGYLAETCSRIAECEDLHREEGIIKFVINVLFEASNHPEPQYNPEYDNQFDDLPSWSNPAPRVDAAIGLIELARNKFLINSDLINIIQKLSEDPVPAVRYQICRRLSLLYENSNDLMWNLIEYYVRKETRYGILHGLVADVLMYLGPKYPDRVFNLTKEIYHRLTNGKRTDSTREVCITIFIGLYIWHSHSQSQEVIKEITNDIIRFPKENQKIIFELRDLLTVGPIFPINQKDNIIRERSWGLVKQLLNTMGTNFQHFEDNYSVNKTLTPEEQTQIQILIELADSLCGQIYFASGAFAEKQINKEPDLQILNKDEKKRFFEEASDVLDQLADFGFPSMTHHLIETLEYFIEIDPTNIFICIGRIVRAGEKGGYQYESLGADLIVKLVERYLAEFREVFSKNEECRSTLIDLLDIFVRAGWPSARMLTYRMEEIFR